MRCTSQLAPGWGLKSNTTKDEIKNLHGQIAKRYENRKADASDG